MARDLGLAGQIADLRRNFEQFKRDTLARGGSAPREWISYAPEFRASTGIPSLGVGGLDRGAYFRLGSAVYWELAFVLGTGFSFATGTVRFNLPTPPAAFAPPTFKSVGHGEVFDASAAISVPVFVSFTTISVFHPSGGAVMDATHPFVWAAGDYGVFSGVYEAA